MNILTIFHLAINYASQFYIDTGEGGFCKTLGFGIVNFFVDVAYEFLNMSNTVMNGQDIAIYPEVKENHLSFNTK